MMMSQSLWLLSYDMSFGGSSPPDNRWPFKEWSDDLLQEEYDTFIDNANNQILNLISESKKRDKLKRGCEAIPERIINK